MHCRFVALIARIAVLICHLDEELVPFLALSLLLQIARMSQDQTAVADIAAEMIDALIRGECIEYHKLIKTGKICPCDDPLHKFEEKSE